MSAIMCSQCVMDDTDTEITFDENGVCNHCNEILSKIANRPSCIDKPQTTLDSILRKLKKQSSGNKYDCLAGISGGLDSSYLIYKMKDWGLNPLLVHVDAGWNTSEAVSNIKAIADYTGFDLYTKVVYWPDIRALQRAYLFSGVPNQDVPQDHIFTATLFKLARTMKIKYIISGANDASEVVFPQSWHCSNLDSSNMMAIFGSYGKNDLKSFETLSFFEYYIQLPFFKGIKVLKPLNLLNYNLKVAQEELTNNVGWKPYGKKHGESRFTKLFQNYILPHRYGLDKRKPHYSSLILSGQLNRTDALRMLREPLYSQAELQQDIIYFCKKLRISEECFHNAMSMPKRSHYEFKNWRIRYSIIKNLRRVFLNRI